MFQDIKQAVRTLRKHPGFVALAALVLGLGIGLNMAIFSIVYAMLFRPLPVADSHSLVSVYWALARQPDRPGVMPSFYYEHFRDHSPVFSGLTGHWGGSFALRADGETDRVASELVMPNYFDVLGVSPMLGRTFLPAEGEVSNPERAVVISHELWRRRFNSDPTIVGKTVTLVPWDRPDLVCTVIGVTGPEFQGISTPWKPTQLWITFAQGATMRRGQVAVSLAVIGRTKPDVTLEQAQAAVATQGRQFYYARPSAPAEYEPTFRVFRTNDVRTPNDPSSVLIPVRLAGAMTLVVGIVLLIAAANIAGILMARGVGRTSEIAIRRVLGAGPLRIARQLLAESILLALVGGAIGFLLAGWLLGLFRAFTPSEFALDVSLEGRVVLFSLAVCLAAGILVGVVPALHAARANLQPWLTGAGGTSARGPRRRLRHAITFPQVALSLALLLVAGAYVRSLLRVELADLGYQPHNLVVLTPTLRADPGADPTLPEGARAEQGAARARRFYASMLERLRAVPGVTDVAIASALPLREPSERSSFVAVSQEDFSAGNRDGRPAEQASVSPNYFRTMGIGLKSGRDFDERDSASSRKVAIVSAALAERLWPGRDPLGRVFTVRSTWPGNKDDKVEWFELVGVVDEVSPILHDLGTRSLVYFPLGQEWRPSTSFVLARGAGDSRSLIPSLKVAITSSDLFADVTRATTVSQMVGTILYPRRIAGAILAASGLIALILATIGIYGVVSYSVAQRTGEIGVRMALGAERGDIIRLVLGEGITVALVGGLAGLALGYAAVRMTSSGYLSLPQLDVMTLTLTPLFLAAVILLACYLPARRAGLIDPMEVLRRS